MLHCSPTLSVPVLPGYEICVLWKRGCPMTSWKSMSSGLTSLWGCSCLDASKYSTTRRGKLEKGSPVPSCYSC